MSKLYLVATPIGNLEDISQRAIRVLGSVGLIAAEDTRRTRKLLTAYGVDTKLTSYHEHNRKAKLPAILKRLESDDVALVSDAGMPGISDPGCDLVAAAVERGVTVVAVPGPSVVPTALAVSGLPADQFVYLGFLPRKKGERRRFLDSVATEHRTLVLFEAPHRLSSSLKDIEDVLGDRRIAVCRELTKLHEEVFRSSVSQARDHFVQPKGEFTLVIEGFQGETPASELTEYARAELSRLRREGVPAKEGVARLALATKLPRNLLYKAWLDKP
jgi:16S rRNA (cytidine1402-2'-O)-methyltransferase